MSWVESNIRATQRSRYAAAVAGQGFAFTELRTPPECLPLGDRPLGLRYPDGPVLDSERMHLLPPVQLFGPDARDCTGEVLSGKSPTTWGWPS